METACLRHTDVPGVSRLFADHQYHFDRVAKFYSGSPCDFESYRKAAASLAYPAERRAAVVGALRRQNGDSAALDELAREGTVAVVTGQQVGLFSGPAYSIYKALTAIRLAARLTESGIRAVPVFWLATEDHDFAEVNEAWIFDDQFHPVRLQSPQTVTGHRPVGTLPLDGLPWEELDAAFATLPFGAEAAALAREAYQPGRTWGEAFRALFEILLAPLEIIFFDPLDGELRQVAAPLLSDAVRSADVLGRNLLERNAELERAGYHAQVHFEPSTSLFFLLDGGERITLRRQNGSYVAPGRRHSADELGGMADRLSPNALLRPVMQDYLLPTAAYIGGPAELAYLAQASVIYDQLLGHMPVAASRSGFTIVDEHARRVMTRYSVSLAEVLAGGDTVRQRISHALVPPHVLAQTERARAAAESALASLETELRSFDPTLAEAAAKRRAKILHHFETIGAKTGREALRRNERAAREAAYLSNSVLPHGHLQERFYSGLALYARFGPELVRELYGRVQLDCPDHQIVYV
jgi:bacillithiol biosynthesis cysteine-adding enzyme BshC